MPTYGRQHYVAQSYLKPFTTDGEHLFSYDLLNKRSFSVNRSFVACENDFYSITNELLLNSLSIKDKNDIDRITNRFFENRYIEIRDITTKKMSRFFDEKRLHGAFLSRQMVDFVLIQYIRTLYFRNALFGDSLLTSQSEINGETSIIVNESSQYKRYLHSSFLLCALYCCGLYDELNREALVINKSIIEIINDLRKQIYSFHRMYMLISNKCSRKFMTSDNPVSSYGKTQLEILIMPLTPQIAIFMLTLICSI